MLFLLTPRDFDMNDKIKEFKMISKLTYHNFESQREEVSWGVGLGI